VAGSFGRVACGRFTGAPRKRPVRVTLTGVGPANEVDRVQPMQTATPGWSRRGIAHLCCKRYRRYAADDGDGGEAAS
jgi:hypothetical protein